MVDGLAARSDWWSVAQSPKPGRGEVGDGRSCPATRAWAVCAGAGCTTAAVTVAGAATVVAVGATSAAVGGEVGVLPTCRTACCAVTGAPVSGPAMLASTRPTGSNRTRNGIQRGSQRGRAERRMACAASVDGRPQRGVGSASCRTCSAAPGVVAASTGGSDASGSAAATTGATGAARAPRPCLGDLRRAISSRISATSDCNAAICSSSSILRCSACAVISCARRSASAASSRARSSACWTRASTSRVRSSRSCRPSWSSREASTRPCCSRGLGTCAIVSRANHSGQRSTLLKRG